jgi:hypothetical protein
LSLKPVKLCSPTNRGSKVLLGASLHGGHEGLVQYLKLVGGVLQVVGVLVGVESVVGLVVLGAYAEERPGDPTFSQPSV